MKNSINVHRITYAAMIAGIYAAMTFAAPLISFGQMQCRLSEMLTILPVFTFDAVPGLSLGCAAANLIGFFVGINPVGWADAIFGTIATLLAAVFTYWIGKSPKPWIRYTFAPLPPVLCNAVIVGLELTFMMGPPRFSVFLTNAFFVMAGEAIICYGAGVPLMLALSKGNRYQKIFRKERR